MISINNHVFFPDIAAHNVFNVSFIIHIFQLLKSDQLSKEENILWEHSGQHVGLFFPSSSYHCLMPTKRSCALL